jgi:hypothetical protein
MKASELIKILKKELDAGRDCDIYIPDGVVAHTKNITSEIDEEGDLILSGEFE